MSMTRKITRKQFLMSGFVGGILGLRAVASGKVEEKPIHTAGYLRVEGLDQDWDTVEETFATNTMSHTEAQKTWNSIEELMSKPA